MKIYTLISIIALLPSICFSQWKIEIKDDGFTKTKLIYTENYKDLNNSRDYNQNCIAISGTNLVFLSNVMSNSGTCFMNLIFTVNGVEKNYSANDSPGFVQTKINGLKNCLFFSGYLKGQFLEDFLNASEIKIKTDCNSSVYEPVIFKSKLIPSESQKAWNENTNGKYFSERELIEKEKIEKDKLQKEQEKQKQIQKETIYSSIINNLKDKNVKEAKANLNNLKAILGYDFSEKKYTDLELMVKNQESNNILDVQTFLNADKIDEAINLLKITSDNQSYQENIRIALMKKLPEPMKLLPNSEINSLLQGFEETLTPIFKNNSNETLTLFINKLGNCEIKNEKGEVKTTFKCGAQYIAINDYHGIKYNVDSKYSLKTHVNKEVGKVVGINLGQAFLKYKEKIENKELLFFHTKDSDGTMILFVNKEDSENIKKDDEVSEIIEVKIVDEIIGKKAKFIISCPLKINDQFFTEINILSDLEINRFKKL